MNNHDLSVTAVVVTYNKPELLKECISSIAQQTYYVDRILVIDNGSFPGTQEVMKELKDRFTSNEIQHIITGANLGGAGGFNFGIKQAMENFAVSSFVWILDDDTIPTKEALQQLVDAAKDSYSQNGTLPGFLASNVRWTDGSGAIMNVPGLSPRWFDTKKIGVIPIRSSSFVSMLVNSEAISKVGYPIKDFFIWGDDVEFSLRISQLYTAYWVQSSVVVHKMGANAGVNILLEPEKSRLNRYFYDIRNGIYISRHYHGHWHTSKLIIKDFVLVFRALSSNAGLTKAGVILRGILASLSFNPSVEKVSLSKNS
jgi:GT2 family glycosyltransferase